MRDLVSRRANVVDVGCHCRLQCTARPHGTTCARGLARADAESSTDGFDAIHFCFGCQHAPDPRALRAQLEGWAEGCVRRSRCRRRPHRRPQTPKPLAGGLGVLQWRASHHTERTTRLPSTPIDSHTTSTRSPCFKAGSVGPSQPNQTTSPGCRVRYADIRAR